MEFRPYRGTERASLTSATEGCLLLTAAVETILVAGLALIGSRAGRGSLAVDAFLRLNALLVQPFSALPLAAPAARQIAAILAYAALCAALTGAVAWLDQRRGRAY